MLNHRHKGLLLLASSLLFTGLAQPVFAATVTKPVVKPVVKLQPQKITSRLALANLLLKHHTNRYNYYLMKGFGMVDDVMTIAPVAVASPVAGETATTTPVSHSDTNIQVSGVDESDIVKVGDDGYIYQIHNNQIRVIKGFPVKELNQTATIEITDSNFSPTGIYIQNGKLVVLGTSWQNLVQPETPVAPVAQVGIAKMAYSYWWGGYSQTRAFVYDMSDHANPKQIRDVAIDGDYLDSRRIGDNLYFVTRTYPRYYMYGALGSSSVMKAADMLPSINDTKAGKTTTKLLALSDISYFPEFVEPDYVVVASLDLAQPDKSVTTKAYLGSGEMVYASMQSLYLSASKYNFNSVNVVDSNGEVIQPEPVTDTVTTQIFKFGIDKGTVTFTAAGEVPGTVLNQFSMDENGDYFRIATTTQNWYSGTNQSHNSLFVLDKTMKTVGKLENLAKGEQIYSTRFMGNRCYVVTFRLTDPLFAIDLSNPENPFVAGELKIPGYSNYLHPYDETHLIGFGKDAAIYNSEQPNPDEFWAGGSAFYQGLKVALFDVADMKNPKELYSVTIGDRGTDSPLLWNHKALYWDAEKHLFGFPVQLYQHAKGFDKTQPWQYGQPTYQGAYIYEVTPETGFTLKAKLSQIPEGVSPVKSDYGYGYSYSYWDWETSNLFVDRLLRIESNLYTLSNNQISVYDLQEFNLQEKLTLKP
ncbi:MAG: beta-propeller domain-containing protein [Methylococcaceae bacterium]